MHEKKRDWCQDFVKLNLKKTTTRIAFLDSKISFILKMFGVFSFFLKNEIIKFYTLQVAQHIKYNNKFTLKY